MPFSNIDNNFNSCDKVCIEAKKVFDACLKQMTQENVTLTLSETIPPNPTAPLTFVSGKSLSSIGIITNLVVDRLSDKPKFGRVQCDVTIPVEVTFIDANGIEGTGKGTLTVHEDVVMALPDPSIIPYEVEAVVSTVCPDGFFLGTSVISGELVFQFSVVACISIILKIVIKVDLLIPTFGYAVIPPCQEFTQEVCEGFFELPLFPSSNT